MLNTPKQTFYSIKKIDKSLPGLLRNKSISFRTHKLRCRYSFYICMQAVSLEQTTRLPTRETSHNARTDI